MKKIKSSCTIFIFSVTIGLMFVIASCKKSKNSTASGAPTLSISTPVEGATYTGSIVMAFTAGDDKGLHTCAIALKNGGSAYYVNNSEDVYNKTSFNFSYIQTALPTALTPVTFTVSVTDHESNTTSKTVNCFVRQ